MTERAARLRRQVPSDWDYKRRQMRLKRGHEGWMITNEVWRSMIAAKSPPPVAFVAWLRHAWTAGFDHELLSAWPVDRNVNDLLMPFDGDIDVQEVTCGTFGITRLRRDVTRRAMAMSTDPTLGGLCRYWWWVIQGHIDQAEAIAITAALRLVSQQRVRLVAMAESVLWDGDPATLGPGYGILNTMPTADDVDMFRSC